MLIHLVGLNLRVNNNFWPSPFSMFNMGALRPPPHPPPPPYPKSNVVVHLYSLENAINSRVFSHTVLQKSFKFLLLPSIAKDILNSINISRGRGGNEQKFWWGCTAGPPET